MQKQEVGPSAGRAISCMDGDGTCPSSRRTAADPDSPPGFLKALLVWVKVGPHVPPEQRGNKEQL